jgi:hypothetical protein
VRLSAAPAIAVVGAPSVGCEDRLPVAADASMTSRPSGSPTQHAPPPRQAQPAIEVRAPASRGALRKKDAAETADMVFCVSCRKPARVSPGDLPSHGEHPTMGSGLATHAPMEHEKSDPRTLPWRRVGFHEGAASLRR